MTQGYHGDDMGMAWGCHGDLTLGVPVVGLRVRSKNWFLGPGPRAYGGCFGGREVRIISPKIGRVDDLSEGHAQLLRGEVGDRHRRKSRVGGESRVAGSSGRGLGDDLLYQ